MQVVVVQYEVCRYNVLHCMYTFATLLVPPFSYFIVVQNLNQILPPIVVYYFISDFSSCRATTNKKMRETVALELSFVNSNLQLLKEQLAELNSSVEVYQNGTG